MAMAMKTEVGFERLSKSDISDLALDAALQLQRGKSGGDFDVTPLHSLALALRHSAGADDANGAPAQMWPGYLDPFERLYRSRTAVEPKSFDEIRDFITQAVKEIDSVDERQPFDKVLATKLIDFCMELNLELGRRQWMETRVDDSPRRDPVEAHLR